MTDKIVLTSDTLSYVNTWTGKPHVQEHKKPRALCGQRLYSGAETHMSRTLSEEQFCQKCRNILNRPQYRRMWHIESEAVV